MGYSLRGAQRFSLATVLEPRHTLSLQCVERLDVIERVA
jgi:hypothetical protein